MLLCRLGWSDKFYSLYPSPLLNLAHPEKHIHHLRVGAEQFPGAGHKDRRHLIIIVADCVVVLSFLSESVMLGPPKKIIMAVGCLLFLI